MKKIFIIILVLVSIQSLGQTKLYAVRLNTNLTTDSFFVHEVAGNGVFNSSGVYIMPRVDSMAAIYGFEFPQSLGKFFKSADGVYRNFTPISEAVDWTGVGNKPSTFPATATNAGAGLLALNTPASNSLIVINSSGNPILRTEAQIRSDLLINNVTNESKATMFTSPAFTGTPTGIGIPVYAWVNGANVTTTGQVLVNITGLSVPLTINARYEFEVVLSVQTSAVTTGTGYGINYSAAGAAIEAHITGSLTATASKTVRVNALNTAATPYLTTSGQTGGIRIRGMITTGANAGDLTVSHRKETSGTSTIFSNSYIKVTRIQ